MNKNVKIYYAKNIQLVIQDKTFSQAMEMVWKGAPFAEYEPLKMVILNTGQMLYMDKNAFSAYLAGDITQSELVKLTQCEELYRNKVEITTEDYYTVDAGNLWKLSNKRLTLVDSDYHITTELDLHVFEIAN